MALLADGGVPGGAAGRELGSTAGVVLEVEGCALGLDIGAVGAQGYRLRERVELLDAARSAPRCARTRGPRFGAWT